MLGFISGVFVGAFIGVCVICLCSIAAVQKQTKTIDKISQELQDAGFEEASKWLDCKYEI